MLIYIKYSKNNEVMDDVMDICSQSDLDNRKLHIWSGISEMLQLSEI